MHYEGTVNVYLQFMDAWLSVPRYIMPIIVSSYQYCNEQQFQTLLCAVTKLDLIIKALLLDNILALGQKYAYASRASYFYIEINILKHF